MWPAAAEDMKTWVTHPQLVTAAVGRSACQHHAPTGAPMNRKQYEDELHNLLSDGQALSQRIRVLMSSFEETASCAEWNLLGQVVMSVATANDVLFTALYPKPSALTDESADADEARTMDQVHDA